MPRRVVWVVAFSVLLMPLCARAARADLQTKPLRTLVFDVTYGATVTTSEQTSGFTTTGYSVIQGHGEINHVKTADDRGTLTVDVIAATSDGSLVVDALFDGASHAQQRIRVAIFRDGRLSFNPKTPLSVEALRVLPFLARGFTADREVYEGATWSQPAPAPAAGKTTYTVTHLDGSRAAVAVDTSITVGSGYTEHVMATTLYQTDTSSPVKIDVTTRSRHELSPDEMDTTVAHVIATLKSDSFDKR